MNLRKIITSILGLSTLLYLSSCRSNDTENTLSSGGATAVKFNLLGADYADAGKGLSLSESRVQSHSVLINPSTILTAELSPASSSPKGSLGLKSRAAINGKTIETGTKFRVIAYRQNGSYQTHQDYTVGEPTEPMMLDGGANYDIVTYSFGTTTLPVISPGETNNISTATVNYDNNNRDFMYQKQAFTPNGNINNTLNLTLRHKVAQMTTVMNVNGGSIENVRNAVLTPHYSDGIFNLSTGNMTGRNTLTTGVSLTNFTGLNTASVTADPVFINNNTNDIATGSFSADVTIGGITKPINLPNSFKITPENNSTLTINLKTCGAYIGPNTDPANFKLFMCQNLGATPGIDPFSPVSGNHGAKYQWGHKPDDPNISDSRYITQADDQAKPIDSYFINTTPLPDNSWRDDVKTENDPCPDGYRVPTYAQWQAVVANNNIERVGTWADSATNYSSAIYIKNKLTGETTMMLPATGYRHPGIGLDISIQSRGSNGNYWSSSMFETDAINFRFNSTIVSPDGLLDRITFLPIRCIAE